MRLPQFLRLRPFRGVPFTSLRCVSLLGDLSGSRNANHPSDRFFSCEYALHARAVRRGSRGIRSRASVRPRQRQSLFQPRQCLFQGGASGESHSELRTGTAISPSDPDLATNLRFAHSLTGAEICQSPLWQRLVFPLAHRVATDQLVWLTSAVYTLLFGVFAACRVWPRRPQWLRSVGWGSRCLPGGHNALAGTAATDERLAATRRGAHTRGHSGAF